MLTPVEPADLSEALAEALRDGPAVAPLPLDPVERRRALAMLRPDLPIAEPDTAAVVVTSGSTGHPKGVVLSRRAIVAATEATHRRLGGPGDWVTALPSHYVAGFMVHARAVVAGTAVRHVHGLTNLPALTLTATRPRYLSLVATQLTRALADPQITAALAGLDAVLLGGGPAPTGLLDRARNAGIRVVTTYGMSETCGGCVYDGVPLDGVDVRLADDAAITVAGPMLFSGYRLRPDLTAETLADERFHTRDRGRWRDGRLEVLGRLDDVVICGGLNVDLAAVERAARPWAAHRSATVAVVGVPDPEWGTEVVAVTDADVGDGPLADLRDHLARTLPAHALPRRLAHRSPLPRTAGGKIDRHRLRAELDPVLSSHQADQPQPEGRR